MRPASLPSVIKAATPRKPAQLVCKETESTEATVTFTNGVNGDDTEKPGWRVTTEGRDAGGTPASGCARVPGGHKPLTALRLVSSRYTHTADRASRGRAPRRCFLRFVSVFSVPSFVNPMSSCPPFLSAWRGRRQTSDNAAGEGAIPTMNRRPRIGITAGDPAGIGPEITAKAAGNAGVLSICEPVVYGPVTSDPFERGRVTATAGRAAYEAIVRAVEDARAGRIDAIATAPINKEAFAAAGLPWPGHTELLAHLTGARRVAMMFYADALRVVLATVHVPLRKVSETLTQARLEDTIELSAAELPRFGLPAPRLAVAGLNPHAGEHGLLGAEEDDVMTPAIAACAARGIDVRGPFPADTLFNRAMKGEFDAVIACYHDQGLIPVKLVAFGRAVNVTLGLPIIRTSVDHGTAFDIAGRGIADPSSLIEAVRLAARLVQFRTDSVVQS